MPFLGDVQSEIDEIDRRQRARETARSTAARVPPSSIPQIVGIAQKYPWIPGGVVLALGQAGIPDERIASVADSILRARERDPQGLYRLGEQVLAEQEAQRPKNESTLSKVFGGVKTGAGWASGVTPIRKALGSNLARNNPVTDHVLEPLARGIATGDNPLASGVRGVSRQVSAYGDFPIQYTQGMYRAVSDDPVGFAKRQALTLGQSALFDAGSQTDLGASAFQLGLEGRVDQGSGFFVGDRSRVADMRRANERSHGVVMYDQDGDGVAEPHSRSIGRDAAGLVVEPGTRPYTLLSGLVDFGVALGASAPTAATSRERLLAKDFKVVGSSIDQNATAIDRLRDSIGMIARPGGRSTYSPQLFDYWADTTNGRKVIEGLAERDAYDIYKATKGKIDGPLLKRLAESQDPNEIRDLLRKGLGHGAETIPTSRLDRYGAALREQSVPGSRQARRMLNRMPTTVVDLDDADDVLQQLDRQLDKMKSSPELKRDLFNRMAAIEHKQGDRITWNKRKAVFLTAVDDWFDRATEPIMRRAAGQPLDAKAQKRYDEIRNIFRPMRDGRLEDETIYDMDAVGKNRSIFDAVIDPASGQVDLGERPSPWLLSEFVGSTMATPDWDQAARSVSKLAPLLNNPAIKVPRSYALAFQEQLWKPLQILRGALGLRVIGEEQAGMFGSGMTSFLNNPVRAMSLVLADSKVGERLRKYGVTGALGTMEADARGRFLGDADEFRKVYAQSTSFKQSGGRVVLNKMARYTKGEPGYLDAAADELNVIGADPIGRMAANALHQNVDVQHVKDAFWQMDQYRKDLAEIAGPGRGDIVLSRQGADAYVDGIVDRIRLKTGDRAELLDALANGADPDTVRKAVEEHVDALPLKVKGQRTVLDDPTKMEEARRALSATTSWLFSKLLLNPERSLSRSSALRQEYWKSVREMAAQVDPKYADTLVESAKKSNLARGEIRLIERNARAQVKNGIDLDTLHEISTGHAVDNVQRIFEDLMERRNVIEALRLVAPFGHVWAEAMTRWGKILKDNPMVLNRIGNALETGRNPAFGELTGAPEGRGFLFNDPATGQERFAYPLSAHMMGMATGADIPLTGSLKGLSLGFDVLPGLGPVVQAPIAAALPNGPEWDDARSILFPHGEPRSVLDGHELAPIWLQRTLDGLGLKGWEDQRTKANATWDTARYLASTGKYNLHDPVVAQAETERLLTDARSMSTKIQLIRGLAGSALPSSPAPEWWLEDKTGRRFLAYALSNEYNDLLATQPENATLEFMRRHGEAAMLLLQGKTVSVALGGGLPPTKEASKWSRANPGLGDDLPLAFGFFAPRNEGDVFDFATYQDQIGDGRVPLTPEQMLASSNRAVAQAQYYAVRNKAPKVLNVQQAAYMRKFREDLAKKYPGYSAEGDDIPGFPARASIPDTIAQLKRAVTDDRLAGNKLTEPLAKFLKLHDTVEATSRRLFDDNKDSWQTNKKGAAIRQMYYEAGQALAADSPEFAAVWETVFYREFETQYERDQGIIDG